MKLPFQALKHVTITLVVACFLVHCCSLVDWQLTAAFNSIPLPLWMQVTLTLPVAAILYWLSYNHWVVLVERWEKDAAAFARRP